MRYFIGFFITIGLIIMLIVLIFSGGSKPKTAIPKPLSSYSNTGAEVSMTIDGPVNAEQDHQQIRVTVSSNSVTYEEVSGYDGEVTERQTYHNTEAAYVTFLRSLSIAGFTKGDTSTELSDERGRCPLGNRYIFELNQAGHSLERYWTTTCGGSKTFLGNQAVTSQLFKAQVPKYNSLSDNIDL